MSRMLSETETHLNMVADERGVWHVYSDDRVMQVKLEKAGAVLVKEHGDAKWYTLRSDQIVIRKGKRKMTEEQMRQAKERMARIHAKRTQFTGSALIESHVSGE